MARRDVLIGHNAGGNDTKLWNALLRLLVMRQRALPRSMLSSIGELAAQAAKAVSDYLKATVSNLIPVSLTARSFPDRMEDTIPG